jgi:cyclopropane fatty-acyl-phospholipid synthase-like methyltransferase
VGKTYDLVIDMNADTSHTRIIRLVGHGKRVLEFGCATGYMSRILSQQFGCAVTGIEVDAEAARIAQQYADRVIVGDAEVLDYDTALGDGRSSPMCSSI